MHCCIDIDYLILINEDFSSFIFKISPDFWDSFRKLHDPSSLPST